MAQYTIVTTRKQEAALKFSFETYNLAGYENQAQFLQARVSDGVLDPMVAEQKRANSVAVNESILTIPEANADKAQDEIEAVIIANGGSLVPPGSHPAFAPPVVPASSKTDASNNGGTLPADRGKDSDNLQTRAGDKAALPTDRPDGERDN